MTADSVQPTLMTVSNVGLMIIHQLVWLSGWAENLEGVVTL